MLLAAISGCKNEPTKEPVNDTGIKIRTAAVGLSGTDREMGYSGTIEASQVIPLTFRTAGTVDKIFVEIGDEVRKGQVLATLDDSDLRNIYNTTLVKFRQAEDAYNRLQQVHEEGSLPEIKWVEMKSDYEQAKSALDLAENNLAKCKLIAPQDGIVGRRNIEPGQSSISLTMAPIELVRLDKVLVRISVPENEINKIKEGQEATIVVTACGGKKFSGSVAHISPVAEVMSRTYTVKISALNSEKDLKPGMVCDVSLLQDTDNSFLVVPIKSVSTDDQGKTFVWVVNPDRKTVNKKIVETGRYCKAGIEITGGLAEGQLVVSEGMDKLSENCKIEL